MDKITQLAKQGEKESLIEFGFRKKDVNTIDYNNGLKVIKLAQAPLIEYCKKLEKEYLWYKDKVKENYDFFENRIEQLEKENQELKEQIDCSIKLFNDCEKEARKNKKSGDLNEAVAYRHCEIVLKQSANREYRDYQLNLRSEGDYCYCEEYKEVKE